MLKKEDMKKIFSEHPDISAVIHFAGLKAVGESVKKPLLYYHDNMVGTLNILDCMKMGAENASQTIGYHGAW